MIPAAIIPRAMAINDFFLFNPSNIARRAPVQPPVPGRGMATNRNNPKYIYLYLVISWLLDRDLASNLFSILAIFGYFFKNVNTFSRNNRIIGIGKTLPIKQMINEDVKGRFSKDAAINPPRSSNIGSKDIIKIIISPFRLPKIFTKKFANASVI